MIKNNLNKKMEMTVDRFDLKAIQENLEALENGLISLWNEIHKEK